MATETISKYTKLEATNNENYCQRLMACSSNIEPPQKLLNTETLTSIASSNFNSSFETLQTNLNVFGNQGKQVFDDFKNREPKWSF